MWTKIREFLRALRAMLNTAHDVNLIDQKTTVDVNQPTPFDRPHEIRPVIEDRNPRKIGREK